MSVVVRTEINRSNGSCPFIPIIQTIFSRKPQTRFAGLTRRDDRRSERCRYGTGTVVSSQKTVRKVASNQHRRNTIPFPSFEFADAMASQVTKTDLLFLYRRLLRSCETYPSKNRSRIYQSIREDFRENKNLEPGSEAMRKQIHVAYKGLEQLHQFDGRSMTNFTVQLEQNPFPKPDSYEDKRTQRVEQMILEEENKK